MKKALCLILAACMCLSLCGCGLLEAIESSDIPKKIDLEELTASYMVDSIDELYCIHYDSDYEFKNDTGIDLPINGIVYVVGYTDGDYDVVICKFTRTKIESFNYDGCNKALEKDGITSPAYWKLKFMGECLEGAMESIVSQAAGATEITYNKWYCYYPEELEALKNGDRLPEITAKGNSGAVVEDAAPAIEAETPAN